MQNTRQTTPRATLSSPLPGKIVEILAREGEYVTQNQRLFIVESMKMFHELRAPTNGNMGGLTFRVGDAVAPHHELAWIAA